MIRHQAVRVQLNAEVFFKLYEVSEVVLKVFIRRKDDLPIVTALNDVMSDSGYNDPRPSWHGLFLLNIDRQPSMMPVGLRKINLSPSSIYTGKQKVLDTGGRVDKFKKRYAATPRSTDP